MRQLWHDQIPFQVADPTGPLVAQLVAEDEIVFRPEVLRHFAADGEYGMADLRGELRRVDVSDADPGRGARPHDGGGVGARARGAHAGLRGGRLRASAHMIPPSSPRRSSPRSRPFSPASETRVCSTLAPRPPADLRNDLRLLVRSVDFRTSEVQRLFCPEPSGEGLRKEGGGRMRTRLRSRRLHVVAGVAVIAAALAVSGTWAALGGGTAPSTFAVEVDGEGVTTAKSYVVDGALSGDKKARQGVHDPTHSPSDGQRGAGAGVPERSDVRLAQDHLYNAALEALKVYEWANATVIGYRQTGNAARTRSTRIWSSRAPR